MKTRITQLAALPRTIAKFEVGYSERKAVTPNKARMVYATWPKFRQYFSFSAICSQKEEEQVKEVTTGRW
jgi:hypothetical protein